MKLSERIRRRQVHWVEHYKHGRYLIYNVAKHTETGELMVLYVGHDGRLWVRPLAMFDDLVPIDEQGGMFPRFLACEDARAWVAKSPDVKP